MFTVVYLRKTQKLKIKSPDDGSCMNSDARVYRTLSLCDSSSLEENALMPMALSAICALSVNPWRYLR